MSDLNPFGYSDSYVPDSMSYGNSPTDIQGTSAAPAASTPAPETNLDPVSTAQAQNQGFLNNVSAQGAMNSLASAPSSGGNSILSPQNASMLAAVVGILGAAGHFAQSKSGSQLPSMPALGALPTLPGSSSGYGPAGGYGYQNYTPAALAANGTAGLGYAPRAQAAPQPASSYYTYGQGPEQQFFQQVKPSGGQITPIASKRGGKVTKKKRGGVARYDAGGAIEEAFNPSYQSWELGNAAEQPQSNARGGHVARYDLGGAANTTLQQPASIGTPPPDSTGALGTPSGGVRSFMPPPGLMGAPGTSGGVMAPTQSGISPSTNTPPGTPPMNPGMTAPSPAVPANANRPPVPTAPVMRAPQPMPAPVAPRPAAPGALGAMAPRPPTTPVVSRPGMPPPAAPRTMARPMPISNTQPRMQMRAQGGVIPGFDDGGQPNPITEPPPKYANTWGQYIPPISQAPAQSGVTGAAPRGALADVIQHRGKNMLGQAAGGSQHGGNGPMMPSRHIQGPGDGTSDSIPARLANGEYVLSADVVSSLGNGDNGSGAKNLDQFVKNVRQHKAANAAQGTLPPDAKPIEHYMQGGRR
jgi:hypothetical protein